MLLETRRSDIFHSDVTNIIHLGFWLWVDEQEYFVAFAEYPAFEQATIREIYAVQRLSPTQFYWPALDIDIELQALQYPDRFPLLFNKTAP